MEGPDLLDAANSDDKERSKSRLNALVAIMVALLATFMGICNVKDGNIVQAMQQAQADKIDHWGWYQAHKIRIEIAKSTITQVSLAPPSIQREKALADTRKYIDEQESGLADVKKQAEDDQKTYDKWNTHDDQFDLAEGSLALAISLFAMTSLTQKRWLFLVALVPTIFGMIMGLSGLFGWGLHPDLLARWLGT
jgi:hypothetical protein